MKLITNKTIASRDSKKLTSQLTSLLTENDLESIRIWLFEMRKYRFQHTDWIANKAEEILELKHKVLGYGFFRIVFDLGNGYVLKVAIRERGFICNKKESNIYRNSPEQLRKHLCPVKESGDGWIIMKKMTRQVSTMEQSHIRQLSEINREFLNYGIKPLDLKEENIALSDTGNIVIIDYGQFIEGMKDFWW